MRHKILHVTSNRDGNIGGAEKLLLDLHGRFDSAQFEFSYANICSLGNANDPYIKALGKTTPDFVNFPGAGLGSTPFLLADLCKLLRRENFDAIHTHLLRGSFIGQVAARVSGISPRILTRHFTNEVFENNRFLQMLDRKSLQIADRIIAVSEAVKLDVLKQRISEDKVEVIHNGIDIEAFDKVLDSAPGVGPKDYFHIGTIGSLTKRKGHEYLLAALAEVIKTTRDIRVSIIGDGPERKRLEQQSSDLGLERYVDFKGFCSQIPQELNNLDLYVHPAVYEPFGIALTEAMAMRKCIVAARVGGIPEIVVAGETGLIVAPGEPDDLARSIIWAYKNGEQVRKMGENGRKRAEVLFDLKLIAARYEQVYKNLLSNSA